MLIIEMESHCKHAKGYEKDILQQYVDRYAILYAAIIIWFFLSAFVTICNPLFSADTFPTHAKYPFNIQHQPLKTIIFVQQSYTGIQIASQLCNNVFTALLLWYATAKFDILSNKLRAISNIYELILCIHRHQQTLRYASDVTYAVRFLVLTTVGCSAMGLLFSGIIFISRQPVLIKMQFLLLSFICLFEVFICCWPANNLLLMVRILMTEET
ncbi:uncharacterized protein LOC116845692 [Odontomachus brunneus]|uniref:uncharacterized protein LOC116845692 n=1 Tax=Odontomachus brunneus TaxID=486640 RepID=UPI0013F20E0E|nr:uncharacterized protein LOC116845692 [Odontomachus brunneus]